jgi:MFS family permease
LALHDVAQRPDRNFWLLASDGGLFSLAVVFFDASVVLPVFVAQLTASPVLIGALMAIRLAGLYLPQLPVAMAIRHFRRMKPFFFWQAAVGRGALIGCVLAALLAGRVPTEVVLALFFVAWAVFSFSEGAATLAWLDLVGDVVHIRLRSRYFGLVGALGGVLSVAGGFVVREALADDVSPPTFAWLFAWGCVAFFASVICISLVSEPRDKPRPVLDEPPLGHLKSLLRAGHLRRLGTAQVMVGSLQLALPFYVLFARDEMRLGDEWLGTFIVAHTIGGSIGALVWSRVAERHGARLVVCLAASLLIVVPLLAVVAERFGGGPVLVATFMLAGAARGGGMAGFWQYTLDLVSVRDRRLFMGLANTANAPTLLMPVLGGALLEWGGYSWLFGASVVLGVGATIAGMLLPRAELEA